MTKFYVETFRPATPAKVGLQYKVHQAKDFSHDAPQPTMTSVFAVGSVQTKHEALAAVLEYASGIPTDVRLVLGGRK